MTVLYSYDIFYKKLGQLWTTLRRAFGAMKAQFFPTIYSSLHPYLQALNQIVIHNCSFILPYFEG